MIQRCTGHVLYGMRSQPVSCLVELAETDADCYVGLWEWLEETTLVKGELSLIFYIMGVVCIVCVAVMVTCCSFVWCVVNFSQCWFSCILVSLHGLCWLNFILSCLAMD